MTSSPTRRTLIAGAAAVLAAPRLALGADAKTLRFVPRTDLGVLDPIWSSAIITRNHAFMVYDTLYGQDSNFEPSPQMVAGHRIEADGRLWRLTLRDSLLWHDGERVLARDCVASIRRWGAKDAFGQALMAATDELAAPDDRTIVFRLKAPFPFLPHALGKSAAFFPAMMPERLATVGPSKQITEIIGSGPFRYRPDERVPGARNVYERFAPYKPRDDGTVSRTAGPKRVHFDRVEWITMSDPGTAASALRAGEVDWIDYPVIDLLPMLRSSPGVGVKILDPKGLIGVFRMNHLQPPFDNPRIRRAVLAAFDQSEFMQAVAGDDRSLWRDGVGFFCPDTPLASAAGMEVVTGPRNLAAAKRAIVEAGYKGEPVALIVSSDFPALKAMSDVAAETLQKIGLNVDYQSLDWGTVQQRRYKRDPVDKGGWSAFCTNYEGADLADPAGHLALRTNGAQAWFGWPSDPKIEELRDRWFLAGDLAEQKALAAAIQRAAFVSVPYIPLGQFFAPTAYRSNIKDLVDGFAIFWNVRRG
ncbi:ABC transporter substrate-binding protein [Methylobacterium sp. J-026]|uniref:ABC transporter substrate-binding protein n=1 Tax=Methylobacterium sp. J-026 TaxID=2836624 RepID=UPI001FB8D447|nr:ABC transporter substrate-binding protein [Methylobacterium sp. J-026]MCJ2135797.1 ABC transporter substrate-binding protein [Methylobacterium sp. J-026]